MMVSRGITFQDIRFRISVQCSLANSLSFGSYFLGEPQLPIIGQKPWTLSGPRASPSIARKNSVLFNPCLQPLPALEHIHARCRRHR